MELFKLLGTIAVNGDTAIKEIDDVTGKAESSEGKISSAFKKIGTAVTTYFAVDKIIDFGSACIQAAADASASSAQFTSVFGDFEEEASGKLTSIADNAGITETRMKDSFTKIAAFAKTTGMETEDAMNLSERAMIAVADSAAFYDRTLEETTESLQSFLKGNYENDAALGLSCTEITRNAAANELYGKSFQELSEQQKQLTLLKMVEDANELSGALGQAARESDTWTNQTGNLKRAWQDFQAILGKPVLATATKMVGGLANGVEKAGKMVGGFIEKMSDAETRSAAVRNVLTTVFGEDVVSAVEDYSEKFGEVLSKLKDSAVERFSGKMESLRKTFGKVYGALQPLYSVAFVSLKEKFEAVSATLEGVVFPVFDFLFGVFESVANTVAEKVAPAFVKISETWQEICSLINDVYTEKILPTATAFIDMLKELWEENEDKINKIGELFSVVFAAIGSVIDWFKVNILEGIFIPAITAIYDWVNENMELIKGTFQSGFDFIGSIIDFFVALFSGDWEGMWESVKGILSNGFEFVSGIFNTMKTFITDIGSQIGEKVGEKFQDIKDKISEKISEAKAKVEEIFDGIRDGIGERIEGAKEKVSDAIDKIKGFFDFEFKWPDIPMPHFSISPSGWEVGDLLKGSIPSLGIEWYAKAMNNPMIMDDPTIFGYNSETGQFMGGGEAGSEVVTGTNTLMEMISSSVAAQNEVLVYYLEKMIDMLATYFPEVIDSMERDIVMDTGALVGTLAVPMNQELGKLSSRKDRGR